MSLERIGKEQQVHEIVGVIISAIDVNYDNLLEPPANSISIIASDQADNGLTIQENYTLQRIYNTAYFIKCQRSNLRCLGGNSPVFNEPIDTIEFRMLPALFDRGVINVRHIDTNGIAIDTEISLDQLEKDDKEAAKILEHLQLNLLTLLVGHSKHREIFNPLPKLARDLLEEAYGKETAEQLWQAGMSNHD